MSDMCKAPFCRCQVGALDGRGTDKRSFGLSGLDNKCIIKEMNISQQSYHYIFYISLHFMIATIMLPMLNRYIQSRAAQGRVNSLIARRNSHANQQSQDKEYQKQNKLAFYTETVSSSHSENREESSNRRRPYCETPGVL